MNAPSTPPRTWLPAFEPEVDHALFLLGYRNLSGTGGGQIGLACLVASATYTRVDPWVLGMWLGYLVLTGLGYFALRRYFAREMRQPGPNVPGVRHWYQLRRTLQVMSAVGWGCLGFLMVSDATAHNVLLMTVFAGVVGHSAAGNSASDLWGFVISGTTVSLVFFWRLPAIFGGDASQLMVMFVFYIGALTTVLRNTHNSLRESIRLRLDNQALAASNALQAARAEQANRDKSEFLAAASHDLRQPVHALLLLIEAYRQQEPSAAAHPLMQSIHQAGQSINQLFNALMELSRLESGTEKPTLVELDLGVLLRDALERVQPEAQAKGLRLHSFQAHRLAGLRLCTDAVLFKRILGNLLANALRYTPSGGVLLALRRAPAGAGVWVEVWDSGLGISLADQKRIFDPYVQIANRERDRSKGIGLGLAIVKHASELLGLPVTLQSRPGQGTRFRITLPPALLSHRPVAAPAPPTPALPVVAVGPWLVGRRILLVDDDPMVQRAMQALLRGWQLDVRTAGGGDASVLDLCTPDWVPECVLSDFRLPGTLNGIEVLDLVQQHYPSAIGILLTGELVQAVQQQAEDAGYLLLSKPVDAGVLASTLGAFLERRHTVRTP